MPRRRRGKRWSDGCGVSFSSLTRSGGGGVGLVASMASPRRVSRVLYLLGRGCRAATTRGFAEPELAHEVGERVGEAR